ncbi:MAG TPA: helix-turn-helix domain-containing protein [Candidatus Limnocylindrales bacterium]
MTTRDEARRRSESRSPTNRPPPIAEPAATLGERLLAARERKGVDLYRAERDTKIRARYLGALERGEYRELPGSVYTKGFLRNYAQYLGLDPDEILLQWRREKGEGKVDTSPSIVLPRPLTAPRQGLTFSPAIVVAALMTLVLVLFVGYLAVQLLRFAKPPSIAVSDPSSAVSDTTETATEYTFRGTTIPHGTVTITDSANHQVQASADSIGIWSQVVPLRRGRNDFKISATDPDTGKNSEQTLAYIVNVPISAVQAPTLKVDSPADGASFQNGAIPIAGTATNATQVVVSASYLGSAGTRVVPTPAPGKPAKSPAPGSRPTTPQPATLAVAADGGFTAPFELTNGRWLITLVASSAEGRTTTLTRTITVAYHGVSVVVTIHGRAWLKVWVDGQITPSIGAAGKVYNDGKVLTFTGNQSVEVRTGASAATYFTVNGVSLGKLGASSNPETWLFTATAPPKQTNNK